MGGKSSKSNPDKDEKKVEEKFTDEKDAYLRRDRDRDRERKEKKEWYDAIHSHIVNYREQRNIYVNNIKNQENENLRQREQKLREELQGFQELEEKQPSAIDRYILAYRKNMVTRQLNTKTSLLQEDNLRENWLEETQKNLEIDDDEFKIKLQALMHLRMFDGVAQWRQSRRANSVQNTEPDSDSEPLHRCENVLYENKSSSAVPRSPFDSVPTLSGIPIRLGRNDHNGSAVDVPSERVPNVYVGTAVPDVPAERVSNLITGTAVDTSDMGETVYMSLGFTGHNCSYTGPYANVAEQPRRPRGRPRPLKKQPKAQPPVDPYAKDVVLEEGLSEERFEKEACVVCMTRKRQTILIPCGHKVMCFGCTTNTVKDSRLCPICRLAIMGQLDKVYE